MSKKLLTAEVAEVLTKEQAAVMDAHKEKIAAYDSGIAAGWQQLTVYAFLCGNQLLQARNDYPHGNSGEAEAGFMKWAEVNFPNTSYKTLQRRMTLAELLQAEIGHASKIKIALRLLDKNPENEKASAVVEKAMHKAMDGKSVTAFLRDEGKIRQPQKEGGFRPNPKAVEEWLKEKHPELVGTKYADLPEKLQAAFRKQYKPQATVAQKEEVRWAQCLDVFEQLQECFDEEKHLAGTKEGYLKHIQRMHDICADYKEDLAKVLKKNKA